ncbi:hypothetical protein LTR08_008712 [Meristemomyces frigidus]|nr:hypothetical protein LTR08_008712 [Meristemomyces frigidus]
MRFRGRTASDKPQLAPANHVLPTGNERLTLNAESLLGARSKFGRRKTEDKPRPQDGFKHVPNVDQRHLGTMLRAQEELLDTQQALLDGMPSNTRKGPKLQMWPNIEKYKRPAKEVHDSDPHQHGRRPDIPLRRPNTQTSSDYGYYDSSRQPPYVSQQTSASSVRDMALHKGSPMIHESGSEPTLTKKPLKSALKRSPDSNRRPDQLSNIRSNSSEKKPRRLDLSQFFPHPRALTSHSSISDKAPRPPSALTDTSEFFPPETVQIQLKRPAGNARFETHKTRGPPAAIPGSVARPKVDEPDLFREAKTNVRRPPKGIQNWFDGFDISSDEEEAVSPKAEPQELPATEAVPSSFSAWHLKPDSEQPLFHRKASLDPVEDNLLAIEAAKERMHERMRMAHQRKESMDSAAVASVMSFDTHEKKAPSRLAIARLANESVLSLSDSSGDEYVRLSTIRGSVDNIGAQVHDAAPVDNTKPISLLRSLQTKRSVTQDMQESSPRQSTSTVQTNQTSGSIPIRLTKSIPLAESASTTPTTKRNPQTKSREGTTLALRKLEGQRDSASQPSRSRPATNSSAQDNESVAETATSLPMDASHMMAVTEEEMILLEMMRNKRAAMQNNSFTEGYQLALKREQEHMARRLEGAQQAALNILRQKDAKVKNRRSSRATEATHESYEDSRRKYSAIRKEDVDKALRLQRLRAAAEIPLEDSFPEPPKHGTPTEENRSAQKFELLMPSTYSPASSKMMDGGSIVSVGESPILGDEDIEDHHYRVREFLAASSATEGTSMFPAPPTAKSKGGSWREKRKSTLPPSPVAEEEGTTENPERSAQRPLSAMETSERRRSISGRRLSTHQIDVDLYVDRASALPAPLRQATSSFKPYLLNPNLDFPPLDFGLTSTAASPSISTSRASPLTPTFTSSAAPPFISATPSDIMTVEGACSSNSDTERSTRGGRAYTPETDMTSLSAPTPQKRERASAKKPAPPKLDTILGGGGLNDRGSIASSTSAGEDVLAAWASLGGGGEAFATRRRAR